MFHRSRMYVSGFRCAVQTLTLPQIYDGAEIFEYRLVPLFPDVPSISRRSQVEDILEGDESSGSSVHVYPFDTLPPIFSRVRPHFVIYDAGRKRPNA